MSVSFQSILFDEVDIDETTRLQAGAGQADVFHDLHLTGIIASITRGRDEYRLAPFFEAPLPTLEAVHYRHQVFRDLEEDSALTGHLAAFGAAMRDVRSHQARSLALRHPLQRQRWFLQGHLVYCGAVTRLAGDLQGHTLISKGLTGFRRYLTGYVRSEAFMALSQEAHQVAGGLAGLTYGLWIRGDRVEVRRAGGEADYGDEVRRTFARFEEGTAREFPFHFPDSPGMSHVETAILDRVARLFPQPIDALAAFCLRHGAAIDPVLSRFDREIQFYLAYLAYMQGFREAGLAFCHPQMTTQPGDVHAEAMFDPALAEALLTAAPSPATQPGVVTSDFRFEGPERVLVVSGANQGGKTTYGRAFGQLHHLAALGCPVPASHARLLLFDALYTHFEREEAVETLAGKLEEELLRMHRVLERATARSVLVMNESFGSTSFQDALFLGRRVLRQIIDRGMLCVCITFLDELSELDPATVSMVSQVDPEDPAIRTFRIVREPAKGLAHALAIARRHRVTYEDLKERLPT